MVVQSVALPKVSGVPREQQLSVAPVSSAAGSVDVASDAHVRILRAVVIVPMLAATELAWLTVLGYALYRVLL
jgi:hypothetical protein